MGMYEDFLPLLEAARTSCREVVKKLPMGLTKAVCKECGCLDSGYMVKSELWEANFPGRGIVCMDCFEKKLGRSLTIDDLTDAPINYSLFQGYRMGLQKAMVEIDTNYVRARRCPYGQLCEREYCDKFKKCILGSPIGTVAVNQFGSGQR
jgi:hypothetical protein